MEVLGVSNDWIWYRRCAVIEICTLTVQGLNLMSKVRSHQNLHPRGAPCESWEMCSENMSTHEVCDIIHLSTNMAWLPPLFEFCKCSVLKRRAFNEENSSKFVEGILIVMILLWVPPPRNDLVLLSRDVWQLPYTYVYFHRLCDWCPTFADTINR